MVRRLKLQKINYEEENNLVILITLAGLAAGFGIYKHGYSDGWESGSFRMKCLMNDDQAYELYDHICKPEPATLRYDGKNRRLHCEHKTDRSVTVVWQSID